MKTFICHVGREAEANKTRLFTVHKYDKLYMPFLADDAQQQRYTYPRWKQYLSAKASKRIQPFTP